MLVLILFLTRRLPECAVFDYLNLIWVWRDGHSGGIFIQSVRRKREPL